jgi:hypothetical protein
VCDACENVITPQQTDGPIATYFVIGPAIGDGQRWVACSEACKDRLVERYFRVLRGEEA